MNVKGMILAFLKGLQDSLSGFKTVFILDKQQNERRLARLASTHSQSPVRHRRSNQHEQTPVRTVKKKGEKSVMSRVLLCGFFNGLCFISSVLIVDYIVFPTVYYLIVVVCGQSTNVANGLWDSIKFVLGAILYTFWIIPLYIMCKLMSIMWFQDVSQTAFKHIRGRPAVGFGFSKGLADLIFSLTIQYFFLVQAILCTYVPYVGFLLYIVHMSLLNGLYAFEYQWSYLGWEVHKRLIYIERGWPYFIGFGLPLALLTQITDSFLISISIFSVFFQFFIISANSSTPTVDICPPTKLFLPAVTAANAVLNVVAKIRVSKPAIIRPES